jgi:hypothetical protein
MRWRAFIAGLRGAAAMVLTFLSPVRAQDLMRHLDLTSPDMTSAEMTRADVEIALSSFVKCSPCHDPTGLPVRHG